MVSVMHATIGIRADGVSSVQDGEGDVKSIEFGGGTNAKKTTKEVQIYSMLKINDF